MRPVIENSVKKMYEGKVLGVIFGHTGTLVDPFVLSSSISFVSAFRQYGFNVNVRDVRGQMGLRSDTHIKKILEDHSIRNRWMNEMGRLPSTEDIYHINKNFDNVQTKIYPSYATPVPGLMDSVNILRDKYNIKIGTTSWLDNKYTSITFDKNPWFVPDCHVAIDELPENLGDSIGSYMIWKCLFNMGISPIHSVVKVDDNVHGIEEGLMAGCWTVGVSDWGGYMDINSMGEYHKLNYYQLEEKRKVSKKRLINSGAHYIIDSIVNLPEVIDDINYKLEAEISP